MTVDAEKDRNAFRIGIGSITTNAFDVVRAERAGGRHVRCCLLAELLSERVAERADEGVVKQTEDGTLERIENAANEAAAERERILELRLIDVELDDLDARIAVTRMRLIRVDFDRDVDVEIDVGELRGRVATVARQACAGGSKEAEINRQIREFDR
jgi:hypothetical protein